MDGATISIDRFDEIVVWIVSESSLPAERIDLANQPTSLIILKPSDISAGISNRDEIVVRVIAKMRSSAIWINGR